MDLLNEPIKDKEVMMCASAHWQSFTPTLPPVQGFLEIKGLFARYSVIKGNEQLCDLCFLPGITLHMNELNLKLKNFT